MNRQAILRSVIYAALFLVFTFIFMLLNYPSERLTDQLNELLLPASKGTVFVEDVRFRLPLSLEAEKVILKVDQRSVEMGRAVVRLGLFSLLSGSKKARVHLENPWLDSSLTVVSSGDGLDLDARRIELDLSGLPEDIMPFPLDLKGKVTAVLHLVSTDPSRGVASGEVKLTSEPIELSGDLLETLGLSPFRISSVTAVATVKDNTLTLGENTVKGDIAAVARGEVRITPANFMDSRLNLTVEFRPGPKYRERLAPIFSLMGARPKADGSVNLRVRGTVGEPSITM
jgi:type II secretion system protein N